jgi:hypothetical protein
MESHQQVGEHSEILFAICTGTLGAGCTLQSVSGVGEGLGKAR